MEATHILKGQGQAPSAGSKSSLPWKLLTSWRAEDRCHEQGLNVGHNGSYLQTGEPMTGVMSSPNPAHHRSYSHPGEPRTGVVSRVQIQLTMALTHQLERNRQAL